MESLKSRYERLRGSYISLKLKYEYEERKRKRLDEELIRDLDGLRGNIHDGMIYALISGILLGALMVSVIWMWVA